MGQQTIHPESSVSLDRMRGIGFPRDREPDRDGEFPEGTRLISSDSHWLETGDVWTSRFPDEFKDKAPEIVRTSKGWNLKVGDKMIFPDIITEAQDTFECLDGMSQVKARLTDLDAEGVEKELLFPQKTLALIREPDLGARSWIFRAYNQYMADVCAQAPDRLYGVGVANFWDESQFEASIAEIKALGLKAVMAPIEPGKRSDGSDILYASPEMDPFWSAVERSGLPFCFHIGEQVKVDSFGGLGAHFLLQTAGFRKSWGALTFGGVFDRHPDLKVVFVEAGINWVAGALQDADLAYETFGTLMTPQLKRTPSWYWFNHCYATFMTDAAGLALLDFIGADRVMWSTDYPHNESTLGYTRSAAQAVFDATDEATAKRIVGETCLDVFDMR